MSRRTIAMLVAVTWSAIAGVILGNAHRDRDIDRARAELATLRAAIVAPIPRDPIVYDLAVRTDYLRTVLRVLVRETYESGDRVRLPDPPPGWPSITLSSDESKSNGHSAKRAWRNTP